MANFMRLSRFLGLQKTCPHCQARFILAKKHRGMLFCPSCEHLLVVKPAQIPRQKGSYIAAIIHSFIMALCATAIVFAFAQWQAHPLSSVLIMMIATAVLSRYFLSLYNHHRAGAGYELGSNSASSHDTLATIRADDCEYVSHSQSARFNCPDCQSYRFVSLFNYKWVRKKSNKDIYKQLEHLSEKHHVGCLSCLTVYHLDHELNAISPKKTQPHTKAQVSGFVCVAMMSFAVLWFSHDVAVYLPSSFDGLGLFFSVLWMNSYSLLSNAVNEKHTPPTDSLTEVPVISLEDSNTSQYACSGTNTH